MSDYRGHCYCEKVKFVCSGDPLFIQYCHCNKCREIASLSKNSKDKIGYSHTAAYLTNRFKIVEGLSDLDELIRQNATLLLCKHCKSLIYGISLDPAKQAGIGVNANNFVLTQPIPDSFKSVRHTWYVNRVVECEDDLPKFKDVPLDQFGSGELYTGIK